MLNSNTDLLDDKNIFITPALVIPRAELHFRTSRSSGPGGQHVNKVETRVEVLFDVASSPSLDDDQRARLLSALHTGLNSEGVLHLVADSYRSQYRNREEAVARLVVLLQHALRPQKPRRPTRITRGAKEQRLQEKKHRGEIKRRRTTGGHEE